MSVSPNPSIVLVEAWLGRPQLGSERAVVVPLPIRGVAGLAHLPEAAGGRLYLVPLAGGGSEIDGLRGLARVLRPADGVCLAVRFEERLGRDEGLLQRGRLLLRALDVRLLDDAAKGAVGLLKVEGAENADIYKGLK